MGRRGEGGKEKKGEIKGNKRGKDLISGERKGKIRKGNKMRRIRQKRKKREQEAI